MGTTKYYLYENEVGDILFKHSDCCYPSKFEKTINEKAGKKIVKMSDPNFTGFVNEFKIGKEDFQLFKDNVLPYLDYKFEDGIGVIQEIENKSRFCMTKCSVT